MKIGILAVGQLKAAVLIQIKENLESIFPLTKCGVIQEIIPLRETAFDKKRSQYSSRVILSELQDYAFENPFFNRVLGVVDADVFVPELNFVFGEATCPGKGALISLWRLRPEFYGYSPDPELFSERVVKEAVHEIGHTLGLEHCPRFSCVMYFSNSISDTDTKQSLFCNQCYLQATLSIKRLGRKL